MSHPALLYFSGGGGEQGPASRIRRLLEDKTDGRFLIVFVFFHSVLFTSRPSVKMKMLPTENPL